MFKKKVYGYEVIYVAKPRLSCLKKLCQLINVVSGRIGKLRLNQNSHRAVLVVEKTSGRTDNRGRSGGSIHYVLGTLLSTLHGRTHLFMK